MIYVDYTKTENLTIKTIRTLKCKEFIELISKNINKRFNKQELLDVNGKKFI